MINPIVEQTILDFLARCEGRSEPGKLIDHVAMNDLQSRLSEPLPDWLADLLSTYPLAGAGLDYPLYKPKEGDDGYFPIQLARTQDIYSETEECYPGIAIRTLAYVCFTTDPTGGGDPYFIKVAEGDNPPVYQVYHDVSDIGAIIEEQGMVKIADSLADFFTKARANGPI